MFEGELKVGGGRVECMAFSPSGRFLSLGHCRGGAGKKAAPALSLVDLAKSKPKPKPSCLVTTVDAELVTPGSWIGMVRHLEFVNDTLLLVCFDGDARTVSLEGHKELPVGPKAPYTEFYDLHGALAAFDGAYFWGKQCHDGQFFALRQREGERDQVRVGSNENPETEARVLPISIDEALVHSPDARRLMVASFSKASTRRWSDVAIGRPLHMAVGGGRVLAQFVDEDSQLSSVLFDADGRLRSRPAAASAISADGRYLAEGSRKPGTESYSFMKPEHRGWLRVTAIESKEVVFEERVSEDYEVGAVAFSPHDPGQLALASKTSSDIRVLRWAKA